MDNAERFGQLINTETWLNSLGETRKQWILSHKENKVACYAYCMRHCKEQLSREIPTKSEPTPVKKPCNCRKKANLK